MLCPWTGFVIINSRLAGWAWYGAVGGLLPGEVRGVDEFSSGLVEAMRRAAGGWGEGDGRDGDVEAVRGVVGDGAFAGCVSAR